MQVMTVERWKDNGQGDWLFVLQDGQCIYAHDYAGHLEDMEGDLRDACVWGLNPIDEGWDGNALVESPDIYGEVTQEPQSQRLGIDY